MFAKFSIKPPSWRQCVLATAALVFGFLIAAGWYVATKGFTRRWRALIVSEFKKQGIEVSLRRLTFDPLHGMVAEEVKLYDARNRRRVLAYVDEIVLGVNYASAIKGEAFLDTLTLHDAELTLPLNPGDPDGKKVKISRLNARVFLPRQQIYLAHAEAEVFGVNVSATGRLLNPQNFRLRALAKESAERVNTIASTLDSLKFGTPPATLQLQFTGDLDKPETLSVDARFEAAGMRRRNYTLERVAITARLRENKLELQQFEASDKRGQLSASAGYDLATGELEARLRSTAKLQDLAQAYARWTPPTNLSLYSTPSVDARLRGIFGSASSKLLLTGHVDCGRLAWRGIACRRLATDFSWEEGRWSLRELHVVHRTGGEFRGDLVALPGKFHLRGEAELDPRVLAPVLEPEWRDYLDRFDFTETPYLLVEARGAQPNDRACTATGEFQFRGGSFEGQPLAPFTATLQYGERRLSFDPFPRGEGVPPARAVYDLNARQLRYEPATRAALPTPALLGTR